MTNVNRLVVLVSLATTAATSGALGAIVSYSGNFSGWQSVAGSYSTCDFTGFVSGTDIDDEYSSLGVLFTNQGTNAVLSDATHFLQDNWGVQCSGTCELLFSQPMHAVGTHVPGSPFMQLYLGEKYVGGILPPLGGGFNKFVGGVSDLGFDRVKIRSFTGSDILIDNIYFSTVPAPGSIVPIVALALAGSRRRR